MLPSVIVLSLQLACSKSDSEEASAPAAVDDNLSEAFEPSAEVNVLEEFIALCENSAGDVAEQQFASYLQIELQSRADIPDDLNCEGVYAYYNTPRQPGELVAQLNLRAVPAFAGIPFPGLTAIRYLNSLQAVLVDGVEISDWSVFASVPDMRSIQLGTTNFNSIPEEWSAFSGLTQLVINNVGSIDLAGFENFSSLQNFGIFNSVINDHGAIGGAVSLENLAIGATGLSFIPEGWSALQSLSFLVIQSEPLTDISNIGGLSNLSELEIFDTRITDFSAVGNLSKLVALELGLSGITSIPSTFSNLVELQYLSLSNESLTSFENIAGLAGSLEAINLFSIQVPSFEEIGLLTGLKQIVIEESGLVEIPASWSNLSSLEILSVAAEESVNIANVINLPSLLGLGLQDVGLASLPDLSALVNLTALFLAGNENIDLTNLSLVSATLESLNLNSSGLTIVPALNSFTTLREVYLSGNPTITDYAALGNMTSLLRVELAGNSLSTTPTELTGLSSLEMLNLQSNEIADVNEIGGIAALNALNISDNPIVTNRNATNCPADALSPVVKLFCTP